MRALHEPGGLSTQIVPIPRRVGELFSVRAAFPTCTKPLRKGVAGAGWEGHSAGWVVARGVQGTWEDRGT